LLDNLPDETTQLLIDICTVTGQLTVEPEEPVTSPSRQATAASYLSFMALPMGNMSNIVSSELPTPSSIQSTQSTVSGAATIRPGAGDQTPRTRESGAAVVTADGSASTPGTSTPPTATGPTRKVTMDVSSTAKRPSPRVYFAHFVDHLDRFVVFLETVALKRWGQSVDGAVSGVSPSQPAADTDEETNKQDQVAVWNTLLELYLTLPFNDKTADAEKPMRDKALRLLERDDLPYDPTHALILCSSRAFTPGLVLLWEKLGMHEDVLRFWIDKHHSGDVTASHQVISQLHKYGPNKKSLYVLVLRFLTSTPELLGKHGDEVRRVLEQVEREGVLSPVGVVQVLSRNGVASVGLVKEWLMRRIGEAREEIETVIHRTYLRLWFLN
jgi:vacuolar protein sorting-associated protein 11